MLPSVARRPSTLRLGVTAISLIALAAASSCGGDSPVEPPRQVVTALRVSADSIVLDVTDTLRLRAEARDATGLLVTSIRPTWTSLDQSVVTVDQQGLATGVARGTGRLVARVESLTDTVTVRVPPPVTATILGQDTLTIVTRETPFEISLVSVSDSGPREGRYQVIVRNPEWISAYVAPSGRALIAMALRDTGTAWVIVREARGTQDSVFVQTRRRAAMMSVTGSGGGYVGRSARLTAVAGDARGFTITDGTVLWESADTSVATIDNTGLVAFRAVGTVTITARHSHGRSATVRLLIEDMPKFAFFRDHEILGSGHRSEVNAVYASGPGVDPNITLTVLDTIVAGAPSTASYGGIGGFYVEGRRPGTTLIIASARLMRPDTAVVRVIPSRIEVVESPIEQPRAQARMVLNKTRRFGPMLRDSLGRTAPYARSMTVNVSSSDTSVILVRPDLRTLALSEGNTGVPMTEVRALSIGRAWLRMETADFSADSLEIIVEQGAGVTFRSGPMLLLGAGQTNAERPVQLGTSLEWEHEATTFTLTQRRPDIARIPDTLGLPSNYLYRQLVIEGLTRGTDTVIASAPGFLPDTLVVVVTSPRLIAPESITGTISGGAWFSMLLGDSTGVRHTPAGIRTLVASASNENVVRPASPARFPEGFLGPWTITMTVNDTGTAIVTVRDTAGVMTPHDVTVRVRLDTTLATTPSREDAPYTIGTRQRLSDDFLYIGRGGSFGHAAPTEVRLRPSDPSVLRVPESVTILPGSQYRLVPVIGGEREGTATVMLSAHLYRDASSPAIHVGRPRAQLVAPTTMVRGVTGYSIHAIPLDPLSRRRIVDDTVRFIVESPDGAITVPRELTILAGRGWSDTVNVVPTGVGLTRLILRDARPVPTPYAPDTIEVEVIPPSLTLQGLEFATPQVGVHQSLPGIVITRTPALGSSVTVDVMHSNGRAQSSSTVIIPAGDSHVLLPIVGVRLGVDTIVVSADGYTPDTGRVVVTEGRLGVWQLPTAMVVGDSVRVEIRTGVPSGEVRTVSEPTTFDLILENGLTTSNGTQPLRSVTVPQGAWRSQSFWIRASQVGTAYLSVSNLYYRPERFAIEIRSR